jgi:hypothetical protein
MSRTSTAGFTRKYGIRIVDPNEYLCGLYEEFPDEVFGSTVVLTRLGKTRGDCRGYLAYIRFCARQLVPGAVLP